MAGEELAPARAEGEAMAQAAATPAAAYEWPSMEVAQAEALKLRAVQRQEDGSVAELPLDASLEKIGDVLGPGLACYFKMLRMLAFVFAALASTIYTANIIITLAAAEDPRGAALHGVQTLAKVSLYPMQTLFDPPTDANDAHYGPGTPLAFEGADKRDLLVVISVLDVFAMCIVLASLAAFKRVMRAEAARVDAETLTLEDYSAVVYGLPREALDTAELTAHLEGAVPELKGTIKEVFAGKNFGMFMERLTARCGAVEALESLDAQAAATKKDLYKPRAKLVAALEKAEQELGELHEDKLECVCAYVTFTTQAAKEAAMKAWPAGALRAALPGLLPKARRFRAKHALRLRAAAPPSDIIWENIQYDAAQRQARQAVAGFLTFALLLITVGFITGAKSYEQQMPPTVACSAMAADNLLECDALWNLTSTTVNTNAIRVTVDALSAQQSVHTCDDFVAAATGLWTQDWNNWADTTTVPATVLPEFVNTPVHECAAKVCHGCYCQEQGFTAWLEDERDLYTFCDVFWQNYINNWFLKGLSIVSVIIINAVFVALIPVLSGFEKLHSRGELDTSIAVKTFLSAFFNAFVITLLVYASITDLDEFPLVFKGAYSDFTPAWYASIGSSLFITTFTQSIQPPVQSMVLGGLSKFLQHFQIGSQYTQRDLNALLAGPQWRLSTRVAQVLLATSLGLVLCGGFPGAGFLLGICAALSYKADKYILLRVARAPPRYDTAMVERMQGVLVWCVWLHFGLTAWMFGDAALPAHHLYLPDKSNTMYLARSDFGQFNVGERLEKWQVLVQGLPFIIMSVWLFVLRPYGGAVVDAVRGCLPARLSGKDASADGAEDAAANISLPDALAAGKVVGLTTYNPRANPDYEMALRTLPAATQARKDEAPAQAAADEAAEQAI